MKKKVINKLKSIYSIFHAYDYPETQGGWKKIEKVALNANNIYFDPYVYKFNDEYWMYVSNRTQNCIELFKSCDGRKWTSCCECLVGSNSNTWDNVVNRACVVKQEDKFLMYYTGQHNNESKIGIAVSDNGYKFERIDENYCLTADKPFENKSVMNPCVLWSRSKKKYLMWYSAGAFIEPDVICYAESKDGINWKKKDKPVFIHGNEKYDRCKVAGCDVHYLNDKYVMYYIGYQNINIGRICMAYSNDGIVWERDTNNPIISPSKNLWDAHSVYKPSVLWEDKKIMLWYNGRKKYDEKIGLAVKNMENNYV